jgi:TonB family protein
MRRGSPSSMPAWIGVASFLATALFVSAQDRAPSPQGDSAPLKVCSIQNPPPCATAPKAIFSPNPEYSEKARKKKAHGAVVLETTVGTDGSTHDIRVVRPLGYGLSEQAVKALRIWKFEPGMKDGKPVPVVLQIEMDFRIY